VKKGKWLLLAGLIVMMMTVGCKKMGEQVDVANIEGNPLVLPLVMGSNPDTVGHVYLWDDLTNLYVKYVLDVTPPAGVQVWLRQCQFDVQLDSTAFPWTGTNPALVINPGLFSYRVDDVQYPFQETTLTIPYVGGWMNGLTVAAATHVVLFTNWYDPQWGVMSGWAQDPNHPFKYGTEACKGWWFPYTLGKPGEWHAMTAWGGHAMPQWDAWKFPGKNWALYINYDLNASSYVGALYAGNPKNDPASHVVGSVTVTDDVDAAGVGNIYVTYAITRSGWAIYDGHTIVRGTLAGIPQANGNPIPGKFDIFFGPFDPPEDQVTVTIPYVKAWGTDLHIGAHAIVGY